MTDREGMQMHTQRNNLRCIIRDNRGSGIVMVLVCMLCVALMGTTMLFMSYTGLRVKVSQRQENRDFYNAEAAVDEIRAGLQAEVSDAIATAYKSVLERYSEAARVGDLFQVTFQNTMKRSDLFENSGTKYKVDKLQAMVSSPSVTVSGAPNCPVMSDSSSITLQGIQVTYTADNNYTTTITTDLTIGMPDFAYIMSAFSISGLPEHALIAKVGLQQTGGQTTIQIDGSAYVGKLELGTAGSRMTVTNGTLVCANTASVSGYTGGEGRFVVRDDAKLWAGRIVVKDGSSVKLSGETRVLDDLELVGRHLDTTGGTERIIGSKATLEGSYYGFGDGTPDDGDSTPRADRSSAILVNGAASTLDLSGLNRLMLAGRAYISDMLFSDPSGGTSTSGVGTLESVSVRSNQQMYLINPLLLNGVTSNPVLYRGAQPPVVTLTPEGEAVLSRYNATFEPVYPNRIPGGGDQKIAYYFLKFRDPIGANQYFEDYFAAHGDSMANYLGDASNLNNTGSSTLGYTIRGKDGVYTVSEPNGVTFDCTGMRNTFTQLKRTLIDSNTEVDADTTPYDYIVDVGKVSAVSEERKFALEDGTVAAIITGGNYEISGIPSSVHIIIAGGDVTVKEDFDGLILCGGTIMVTESADMTAAEDEVVAAFNAVNVDGADPSDTVASYLLHGGRQGGGGNSTVDIDPDGWNLDKLVTYQNWTKN